MQFHDLVRFTKDWLQTLISIAQQKKSPVWPGDHHQPTTSSICSLSVPRTQGIATNTMGQPPHMQHGTTESRDRDRAEAQAMARSSTRNSREAQNSEIPWDKTSNRSIEQPKSKFDCLQFKSRPEDRDKKIRKDCFNPKSNRPICKFQQQIQSKS